MTCPILKELEKAEPLEEAVVPEDVEAELAVAVPGAARLLVPPRLNFPCVVGWSAAVVAVAAVPDVDMVLVEPSATGVKLFDEPNDELFI